MVKHPLIVKILFCSLFSFGMLYAYIDQQNKVTKLKIELPQLAKEIRELEEENTRLQYEVEMFENPSHLMTIAKRPEFSHLKHPTLNDICVIEKEGTSKVQKGDLLEEENSLSLYPRVVIGAR